MFEDPDEFFSVNFPAEPTVRNFEYASEYGATLPDRTDEGNNAVLWLYDQRGSVAYAARIFRLRGGEATYDAWHPVDLVEVHQLQMTNADQSRTYASMYLHDGRLYVLEATVPPGSLPQGLIQQSLSFLDAEGKRIRYRLSPDGSRTRLSPR
jgi:hypothetical protein